ncbi:acyltransferase, partial [bacterium]|nr:acyltransferase [Candidatus Elulimicrobium humile]
HYSLLDLSRFLAAISVVIYHYQHFFEKSEIENLNWYTFVSLFIQKGHLAVPFFWMLSGFVIASSYPPHKKTSVKKFLLYRFARLYPLHLATLIFVTILQFYSILINGKTVVYPNHDFSTFFIHLLFLSGFFESFDGNGFSFNAPVWSVSLELMCYLTFAFMTSIGILNPRTTCSLLFLTFLLDNFSTLPDQLIRVNLFFFTGVLLYFLRAKKNLAQQCFCTLLSCFILGLSVNDNPARIGDYFSSLQIYQYRYCVFFAVLILLLLKVESWVSAQASKLFVELGNLSYGIYLLHVPIQMALILTLQGLNRDVDDMASTKLFIFSFLLIVLVWSWLVFKY